MKLELREWQEKAKTKCLKWFRQNKDNRFVLNCAPGTGKTFAAIAIADELLKNQEIETVIVIAPQDSVVDKWGEDFFAVTGKYMQRTNKLDGDTGTSYCSTWQSMSSLLDGYQRICNVKKTMVICDEQHHAAAAAVWGNSAINAFENAKYILMLSGTPIRSDSQEPAFLPYEGGELAHPKEGQYILTYGEAINLGYCRPIAFERHEANFDILDDDGGPKLGTVSGNKTEIENSIEDTAAANVIQEANRFYACCTTIRPNKDGSPDMNGYQASMIENAIQKLEERKDLLPFAGGLIIAPKIEIAEYMAEIIKIKTNKRPVIVHNGLGAVECKERIKRFRKNHNDDWLVSVDMIGEGVDIQRLRVLVYLPRARTDLRFRQAMGRVVRKYEENGWENDVSSAYVVMPAFEVFDKLAKGIENEMPGTELKPKSVKICPSCQTENKKDAKECISKSCDYEWPPASLRYKKCKDDDCGAINPIGAKCCQTCGNDFGTQFVVTLKDVFRDKIISRGVELSNEDIVEAEKLTNDFFNFVERSTNPFIIKMAKENPPEALVSFHKELGEFLAKSKAS
tara:strand:+ start:690 stop:2393 length:1704 start_codon:yes stop_codon:yes gene_type:complete